MRKFTARPDAESRAVPTISPVERRMARESSARTAAISPSGIQNQRGSRSMWITRFSPSMMIRPAFSNADPGDSRILHREGPGRSPGERTGVPAGITGRGSFAWSGCSPPAARSAGLAAGDPAMTPPASFSRPDPLLRDRSRVNRSRNARIRPGMGNPPGPVARRSPVAHRCRPLCPSPKTPAFLPGLPVAFREVPSGGGGIESSPAGRPVNLFRSPQRIVWRSPCAGAGFPGREGGRAGPACLAANRTPSPGLLPFPAAGPPPQERSVPPPLRGSDPGKKPPGKG